LPAKFTDADKAALALNPFRRKATGAQQYTGVSSSNRCSNLTAAWQIRGNFSTNPRQPQHPSPSRIRREKASSCRMKKRAAVLPSVRRNEIA
jgi:hypothetical protein